MAITYRMPGGPTSRENRALCSCSRETRVSLIFPEIEANRIGDGQFVRITMPSGEAETVYGFATEADAAKWIRNESQAWLYERKAPRAKLAN
jgi:hypothetical protein